MTHTTTVVRSGNQGDHNYVVADVDITSLGAAGLEAFDPASEFALETAWGATVLQQANGGYHVTVDQNNDLAVTYGNYDAAADGVLADVPAATAVGVVRVKFMGDPSA